MSRTFVLTFAAVICICASLSAGEDTNVTETVARQLAEEGDHLLSAVEYRRLALLSESGEATAGSYWASAYQYWMTGDHYVRMEQMLDRAERLSSSLASESMLLRAVHAIETESYREAAFYLESLLDTAGTEQAKASSYSRKLKDLASLRLAEVRFSQGRAGEAQRILQGLPYSVSRSAADCISQYRSRSDKSPAIGGLLGLVPGLGYAYSGEYSNALRSLILNGIFIYAMSDTAANEQWGAFTALSFFELTWYTGSIYGGIDAAHRYNRDRFERCRSVITGGSSFSMDLERIPLVKLTIDLGHRTDEPRGR